MKARKIEPGTYLHRNAIASTALTTLNGLLLGIACDKKINSLENAAIEEWIGQFSFLKTHPAVGSVFDILAEALADGILSTAEVADLKWAIEQNLNSFYDETTKKIQTLNGLMAGIAADSEINAVELAYMWKWLNESGDLKGLFPYDEIYSVVFQMFESNHISEKAKEKIISTFRWIDQDAALTNCPFLPWEVDPQIVFAEKVFCLTGVSHKAERSKLEGLIQSKGGVVALGVSKKIDYLVICECANVAWTHATYGRKIEEAIKLRRAGHHLSIISEKDFWDALVD